MTDYSYILRECEQNFIKEIEVQGQNRDVILVEGARQTGKTSMIKHCCVGRSHVWIDLQKDKSFLKSLDETDSFEEFTDLLLAKKSFSPGQNKILIIDEAQESQNLGGYVRSMKEDWDNQTVVLLGSLMARLFRKGVKFPVGSVRPFKIYPFTFREFLRAKQEKSLLVKLSQWKAEAPLTAVLHEKMLTLFDQYLKTGGLPDVVSTFVDQRDWQKKLHSIAWGYVEDFKRVEGEENSGLFEHVLKRIAQTLGSPSKLSTIVQPHQPGYRLLPSILSLLESWLMVHKVPVETTDLTQGGRIPPKRYLFDHGIRHIFSPLQSSLYELLKDRQALNFTFFGGVMENAVLNELLARGIEKFACWREKTNGSEVDFLCQTRNGLLPVEVKSSLRTNQKFFSSLHKVLVATGCERGVLVSGDRGRVEKIGNKTIEQIPFYAVGCLDFV